MTERKEEEIKDIKQREDILGKTWMGVAIGCVVAGLYGWIFNDFYFIVMSLVTFFTITVGLGMLFGEWHESKKELEEEMKMDELEERIENLEELVRKMHDPTLSVEDDDL